MIHLSVQEIGHLFVLSLYFDFRNRHFPLHFTETDITNNKAQVKESLARVSITIEI